MTGSNPRLCKRVDTLQAEVDHDRQRYRAFDPWTGEEIATYDEEGEVRHGVPLLTKSAIGKVMDKKVEHTTITCPDCGAASRMVDNDPLCPQCGLICDGKQGVRSEPIIIDAKTAGRISK